MRHLWFVAALGLVVSTIQGRADEAVDHAAKRLEGEWLIATLATERAELSPDPDRALLWRFQGVGITVVDPDGATTKLSFRLAPSTSPKGIDVTALDGPWKGQTMRGIYEVADGRLRLCLRDWAAEVKDRPTAFKAGLGILVLTFKKKPS